MATAQKLDAPEQLSIVIPDGARRLKTQYLERALIDPDPAQPRKDPDDMLRASIARNGILQPITVRPHPEVSGRFMIVDGERRWRGSEGVLDELPAQIRRDQEEEGRRLITQLVANTGKPLTPLEEARTYATILRDTGMSVTDLATMVGTPRSTMGERLALLELGPWLALLEAGDISVSHAVRALVPVRMVPDKYHEQAIAAVQKDWRWQNRGRGDMSVADFEKLVEATYRPFLYPLAKTKNTFEKQPAFPTSKHDVECGCGKVKWDLGSSGSKRVCCANPDWWKPLHRKALAEAKKKAPKPKATNARAGVQLYLPEGTPTIKGGYDTPKGLAFLTDTDGRWSPTPDRYGQTVEGGFDPADLDVDESKLVRVAGYGGDQVATKDLAAVKAARAKWAARWTSRLEELQAAFRESAVKLKRTYEVTGPGAYGLLAMWIRDPERGRTDPHAVEQLLQLAGALGITVPDAVVKEQSGNLWQRKFKHFEEWTGKTLTGDQANSLITGLAMLSSALVQLPGAQLETEQREALHAIAKLKSPWTKKPKGGKAAPANKGHKRKAAAAPVDDDEIPVDYEIVDGADDEELLEDEGGDDLWDAEGDDE